MVIISLLPLGTCAGNRTKYQEQSSYLLRVFRKNQTSNAEIDTEDKAEIISKNDKYTHGDEIMQILLDAGSKRSANPDYVNPNLLRFIIFSHAHLDHTKKFPALVRKLSREKTTTHKISIISSPKTLKILRKLLYLKGFFKLPKFIEFIPFNFSIRKDQYELLNDLQTLPQINIPLGGFCQSEFNSNNTSAKTTATYTENSLIIKLSAKYTIHTSDSIAISIDFYKKTLNDLDNCVEKPVLSLIYSPDCKYNSENLIELAADKDYWILDSTFNEDQLKKLISIQDKSLGHSSPERSAQLCEKARVKNYIVAHYFWKRFGETYKKAVNNLTEITKAKYSGNVHVSQDLIEICLN